VLLLLHCAQDSAHKKLRRHYQLVATALVLPCLQIPYTKVLRFINKVAGAIHRAVPGALVTVGAHSVPYISDLAMPGLQYPNAPLNYFSDDLLVGRQWRIEMVGH
jgi:hypothetical protein